MHCTITDKSNKVYLVTAKGDFKKRICNHRKSFNNETSANRTTFSKHIWELKETSNANRTVVWSNARNVPPYSNISKKCLLCLPKIINYPRPDEQLNIRSESIHKYRPANKFLLRNIDCNPLIAKQHWTRLNAYDNI